MVNVLAIATKIGATMVAKKAIRSAVGPAAFKGIMKPLYYVGEAGLSFAAGDLATASMVKKQQIAKKALKVDMDKEELLKLIDANPYSTQI